MRWPLRVQILVPSAALMLVTLVAVSALNAYLSARLCRQHIEQQLTNVVRTLNESTIPIAHDAVLGQMRGLSGAEYVLTDRAGTLLAASRRDLPAAALGSPPFQADLNLENQIAVGQQQYFHAIATVNLRRGGEDQGFLHILFPVENYQALVRQGLIPPLVVGGVALCLAVLLGALMAAHVTRPILRLRRHVSQIAQGDFRPIQVPRRNDELRDLAADVNQMAEMLARYEDQVRRREKVRTLGQLGGGLAHQLRNSATGCRMALELHRRECPKREDADLEVAARQLNLMERYLQRFLSPHAGQPRADSRCDLGELLDSAVTLVGPAARHHGAELTWHKPERSLLVRGDPSELEQVFVNLLVNALEAAVEYRAAGAARDKPAQVNVAATLEDGMALIEVSDNGPGPALGVRDSLFEPLVTDKADGTGLGLSVARDIVERHGGRIAWERSGDRTCFQVRLPLAREETAGVEAAGH